MSAKTPRPSAPRTLRSPQEQNQFDTGFTVGKKQGTREGQETIRKIALDWLEGQYMSKDVKRGTPKADAILEVTRQLALVLKEHII